MITVPNLHIDTVEYIHGMLAKDRIDEWDTRERVHGILMEELLSKSDVDGVAICDRLLYLLDGIKYDTDDPMANTTGGIEEEVVTSPPGMFGMCVVVSVVGSEGNKSKSIGNTSASLSILSK